MKMTRLLIGALAAAGLAGPALAEPPQVKIDSGLVQGLAEGPAVVFRAIPYAAPPVGDLRWKPPHAPAPWEGVRIADHEGPACAQKTAPGRPNEGGYMGPVSEDCLTLDVTAPPGAKKAPVMVWIYGGGNVAGADDLPSYDAHAFARDGVVLVAMNYRLGPFGFFAHPALTAEAGEGAPLANYGLMDQRAALSWVRRNIAAFGGDPDNVTIFGESAGGEDVLALMTVPSARGLFQKAIVQSGPLPRALRLVAAEAEGVALAERLDLQNATAAQLRALSVDQLLSAADEAQVSVDGGFVEQDIGSAFSAGRQARIPLILGWNSNEASLLGLFHASPEQFAARASASVKAAYPASLEPAALGRELFNDEVMGAPARAVAADQTAWRAPAWLYYFSYLPTRYRAARPGVNHASEIPYVFDSLDAVPGRARVAEPTEREMASLVHGCWVAFARSGRPDCAGGAWKAFDPSHYVVFEFGEAAGPRVDFRKAQLDAQAAAAQPPLPKRP